MSFQKICEKPQIVNDYEAGRGLPNQAVLGKIERAIGKNIHGSVIISFIFGQDS